MRTFPSGAHVAEVEIDRETGSVEVVDYTAVDDIGNVINHVLADGQLHGGVMQGAGQAFGENCLYDEENGQLVAGSFMDYVMPRADLIRKHRARSTRWCRRPATRSAPRAPARPARPARRRPA